MGKPMAELILGQVLSFAGDPFVEGVAAARHESRGAILLEHGKIAAIGTAELAIIDRNIKD